MGADKQITGDITVFSVGGSSVLAILKNVSYKLDFDEVDGSTILVQGEQPQQMKRGGVISTTLYSTISDATRVTALECSAFSITVNGVPTSYQAVLKSCKFSGTIKTSDTEGSTGPWKWTQYMGKKQYEAQVELFVSKTVANILMIAAHNADRTQINATLDFTVNGEEITLPMVALSHEHVGEDGAEQLYRFTLKGKAPDGEATGTAYPTLPTTTSSLLEKAFNAPGTALAFALTTGGAAGGGLVFGGSMVYQKFGFSIDDGQLVSNDYTWGTQGVVTCAAHG